MEFADLSQYLAKEESERLLEIGDAAARSDSAAVIAGVSGLLASLASGNAGLGTLTAGITQRLLAAGSYARANRAIAEAYARDSKEEQVRALAGFFSMLVVGAQADMQDGVEEIRSMLTHIGDIQSDDRLDTLEHRAEVANSLAILLAEVRGLTRRLEPAPDPASPPETAMNAPSSMSTTNPQGELYISYAWSVDDPLIDAIEASLSKAGFVLHRDKRDVGYGASISEFMEQLGDAKLVLVVISDKYLRSPYCVGELLSIYRSQQKANAAESKARFQRTILPIVLPDAKGAWVPPKSFEYLDHWKQEAVQAQTYLRDYGTALASERLAQFREIEDFKKMIDSLLVFVGDLNSMSVEALASNDFERLREAVAARLGRPADPQEDCANVRPRLTSPVQAQIRTALAKTWSFRDRTRAQRVVAEALDGRDEQTLLRLTFEGGAAGIALEVVQELKDGWWGDDNHLVRLLGVIEVHESPKDEQRSAFAAVRQALQGR